MKDTVPPPPFSSLTVYDAVAVSVFPASSVAVHVAVFVPADDVLSPDITVDTSGSRLSVAVHVPVIVPPSSTEVFESVNEVIFGDVRSTVSVLFVSDQSSFPEESLQKTPHVQEPSGILLMRTDQVAPLTRV